MGERQSAQVAATMTIDPSSMPIPSNRNAIITTPDGKKLFQIAVDLPHLASAKGIDLSVEGSEALIAAPGCSELRVSLPSNVVDEDALKCKFDTATHTLFLEW